MRLVCDNYVIHDPYLSVLLPVINSNAGVTRITCSASATGSITCFFYVRKLRFLRKVRIRIIRTIRKMRTYFSIVTISHNQWLK